MRIHRREKYGCLDPARPRSGRSPAAPRGSGATHSDDRRGYQSVEKGALRRTRRCDSRASQGCVAASMSITLPRPMMVIPIVLALVIAIAVAVYLIREHSGDGRVAAV